MRRRPRVTLGAWAIVGSLSAWSGPSLAEPEPLTMSEPDESMAPIDCWPMPDGCPGRTATCETAVPRGAVEEAWAYEPPGAEIVGEPLVWKHLVVVPYADGFDVLDLEGGGVVASKRKLAKGVAANPVMGPGFVLAQTALDRIDAFAIDITAKSVKSMWSWKCPDGPIVTRPLVSGREVVVLSSRMAYRLRVGRPLPVSTDSLEGPPVGDPSLVSSDLLYVTERDDREERIVELHAAGRGVRVELGLSARRDRAASVDSYRIVGRAMGELFVVTSRGLKNSAKGVSTTAMMTHAYAPGKDVALYPFVQPPVLWRRRWILSEPDEKGSLQLLFTLDPEHPEAKKERERSGILSMRRHVLATAGRAAHLADVGVPATATRDAILLGPYAFDPVTHGILFELPVRAAFRAVPARGTVLLVEGDSPGHGKRLRAFRASRPAAKAATVSFSPTLPAEATPDAAVRVEDVTVVRRDGTVRSGAITWKPGTSTIAFPPPAPAPPAPPPTAVRPRTPPPVEERWLLADVALIVDRDRRVLHAGDPDEMIAATRRVVEAGVAKEWLAYVADALKKGSTARAGAALAAAEALGTPDAEVWRMTAEIDAAERRSRKASAADEKALAAKELAIRSKAAGTLWSWAAGIPKDAPLVLTARLARIALDTDPSTEGPSEWTRAHVPTGVAAGGASFPTRDWLDYFDALQTTPVRIVEVPPVQKDLTNSERHLGAARLTWRKDLVAFESKRAVVITPVSRPGRIARCLATAELVCRALESIFGEFQRKRAETDPLVMFLYETKEEYLEQSKRKGGNDELEWTLGHYTPFDGVSRLYVPDGDEEFQSVVATFAHELTHHWMDLCCPAFSDAERVQGRRVPSGYWVEEGFAEFIEEGRFDLRTGEHDLFSKVAASIDVVANASPSQLLDWDWLLTTSHVDFADEEMSRSQLEIPMRWRLGFRRNLSKTQMFYFQSAAATRWFYYADGGAHRAHLLRFVAEFHANRTKPDTLSKLVGMTYEEIGARIVAWAKERQRSPTR